MPPAVALNVVVERTRRRQILNLAAGHIVRSVVVFLAGFALLLVLGTSWVGWYWPLLLALTMLVVGWRQLWPYLPDGYTSAQTLDRHLQSNDLLSTAYHFAHSPQQRERESQFLGGLISRAEAAATGVSPEAAVPLRAPGHTWVAGALLAGIASLLFVRYGIQHNFDLKAPLVSIRFDTLTGTPEVKMAKNGRPGVTLPTPETMQVPVAEDGLPEQKDLSPAPENALETAGVPDVNQAADPNKQNPRQQQAQTANDQNEAGDESNPSDSQDGEKDTNSDSPSTPPAKAQPDTKQQPPKPQESNSLLDKMKDAFANMMNKLNMQPPPGQQNQQQAASKQGQKGGEQKGEKGQQTPSKGDSKSDQQADADSEQKGDPSEQAQGNKSSQGDQSSDEKSNDQRSGMGKQDGKKDTELAQQLEAMGKISEILGKRADNIKGEMMIEVQNSKQQQLKTPYLNRSAGHKEMGGEINRDEIPLHLHQYIDSYYQQVRKSIPATATQPPPGQTASPAAPRQ